MRKRKYFFNVLFPRIFLVCFLQLSIFLFGIKMKNMCIMCGTKCRIHISRQITVCFWWIIKKYRYEVINCICDWFFFNLVSNVQWNISLYFVKLLSICSIHIFGILFLYSSIYWLFRIHLFLVELISFAFSANNNSLQFT